MPAPPDLTVEFAAPVLRLEHGARYHIVPLPVEIADAFRDAGVKRLMGTVNDHPVRRAIQGRQDGERYLVLGRSILRAAGAQLGDRVVLTLRPDPEPDRIDLDEAFEEALRQEPEAAERFYGFTPGRQRSLAHYVSSAKRPATRIKRALELVHKLKTHTLYGDQRAGDA